MVKVLGFRRKKGSFVADDGRQVTYDNIELYIFSDEAPEVQGFYCDSIKLPFKQESFENVANVADLLNREIELVYQVFGYTEPKLIAVRALEQKAKA